MDSQWEVMLMFLIKEIYMFQKITVCARIWC